MTISVSNSIPLLQVRNLKTCFYTHEGVLPAVNHVSFNIEKGEVLGIVGESGCGKTVLSLSIMKMIYSPGRIDGGQILFQGRDLVPLSEKEMEGIRGSGIGMIFQDPLTSLNPVFSIEEQMTEPLMVHQGLSRKEAREKIIEILKRVDIPSPEKRIGDYPHQFSGGQRQRIMIGSALSLNPPLLLADEPTTALDVSIQAQILELLTSVQKEYRISAIFISHNLGVIAGISHRVAVMYGGWIVERGSVDQIFDNPLHPYTRALLSSVPGIKGEKKRLVSLPGSPPRAGEVFDGCLLYPRCPQRMEGKCNRQIPPETEKEKGHGVKCFLYL